jgi:hypothetical protein
MRLADLGCVDPSYADGPVMVDKGNPKYFHDVPGLLYT